MATSFDPSVPSPTVVDITLSATANRVTAVTLPDAPGDVSFLASAEAYWQPTGTDATAADSSVKATIAAGAWVTWRCSGGRTLYIGSSTSGATVKVAWERI